MGFLAAAIPIATSLLGAMSEEEQPQQAPQPVQPPPTLGEIFAMNGQNYQAPTLPLPGQNRGS
jgi:hypothetical protein